jgi:hypothetical protein
MKPLVSRSQCPFKAPPNYLRRRSGRKSSVLLAISTGEGWQILVATRRAGLRKPVFAGIPVRKLAN